jgi:hypothetical protein
MDTGGQAKYKSVLAALVTAPSTKYFAPLTAATCPAPVNAGVGLLPKSAPSDPRAKVAPVFVMPDPARTAKDEADPSSMPEVVALASWEIVAGTSTLRNSKAAP